MPRLCEDMVEAGIYARPRESRVRYSGDFRDYSDVGGAQEPLIPVGERCATTEFEKAKESAEARLQGVKEKRNQILPLGRADEHTFDSLIPTDLEVKVRHNEATQQWLGNV